MRLLCQVRGLAQHPWSAASEFALENALRLSSDLRLAADHSKCLAISIK